MHKARRLVARVPRPLAMLLGVVAVFGVCWAMLAPPWQSPDAFSHYSYIESLGTRLVVPGGGGYGESSSSVRVADAGVGAHEIQWSSPEAKPSWSPSIAAASRRASGRLSRSNGGGPTPSAGYPPLYYATAVGAYLAPLGGDSFDRLNAVQLWGVLLLLGTVTGAWLLAGEVFGRRRLLQLITAAVAGLEPMSTFLSTSVTPDALLLPLWTLVLWAGARVIKRGAPQRDVKLLCALLAAAILTKPTSYALIPACALALVIGWRRGEARSGVEAVRLLGRALILPVLVVLGWTVIQRSLSYPAATAGPPTGALTSAPGSFLLHFFDYVWQFYLPRLPGQYAFHVPTLAALPWPRQLSGLPLWNLWIRQGWGVFGWVDVYMTGWVYVVLAVVTGAVAIGAVAIVVRACDALRLSLVAFFAVAVLSLLAVVHVIEYEFLTTGQGAFIQGRYLLPIVSLFGLAVALVVSRLPARARGPAVAVVMVGLLALQVLALATVARTYYT
ncbi:MAG: DUF2142 domain-containing protein [Solirubrobacteraceae bacterium]